MSLFWDVQDFVREVNRVTTFQELSELMSSMSKMLGFDYFALVHHVELVAPEVIDIENYPSGWREMIIERKYTSDDPILVACEHTNVGFRWSDIHRWISLSKRQKEILDGARTAGIGEGFTVPVHIPGEYAGSCSFSLRLNRRFDDSTMPAAQFVGCFGFEAARRVLHAQRLEAGKETPALPRLTPRQLDCVVLAAAGKSDWDAAQLLGISDQTVHQHIEDAKRRYGVATRLQLVVRALFDGQLTFRDIVH
ncbi:MAG TPA: LuxR family transcriptional regulator [Rhizomicrobium sp.]|nr:LuxR family transcriptional regulator [Rhizomicrobium sp.]